MPKQDCCTGTVTVGWLSGKLWYLQNNSVGDTIVYYSDSESEDDLVASKVFLKNMINTDL